MFSTGEEKTYTSAKNPLVEENIVFAYVLNRAEKLSFCRWLENVEFSILLVLFVVGKVFIVSNLYLYTFTKFFIRNEKCQDLYVLKWNTLKLKCNWVCAWARVRLSAKLNILQRKRMCRQQWKSQIVSNCLYPTQLLQTCYVRANMEYQSNLFMLSKMYLYYEWAIFVLSKFFEAWC